MPDTPRPEGDETPGPGPAAPTDQPDSTQIEPPDDPVETDVAHPTEAMGEPAPEEAHTPEFLHPEQQVQEPDANAGQS